MALDARSNTQDANGNIAVRVVPATPEGGAPSGVVLQDPSGTAIVQPYPVNLQTAAGVEINFANPTTGTLTNVSMTGSSVTVLASNTARKGGALVNDGAAAVYVKYGTGASSTSFSFYLAPSVFATHEVIAGYTGNITALGASGTVRATELT